MRAINFGDVFILHDVIHGPFSKTQQKALHYAFGTLSGRPVVVIRPPAAWDRFGQVTIIPAMSKTEPYYETKMEDVFGKISPVGPAHRESYKWIPHFPYTVPVSRLGKYIGSLSLNEMKETMEAFEWVHNPFKQMDPNIPVPAMYKNATEQEHMPMKIQAVHLNKDFEMSSLDQFDGITPKVSTAEMNDGFISTAKTLFPKLVEDAPEESTITPEESEEFLEEEPEAKKVEIPIEIQNNRFSMNDKIEDFIRSTAGDKSTLYILYASGKFVFHESDVLNMLGKPHRDKFNVVGLPLEADLKEYPDDSILQAWETFESLQPVDLWLIIPNMKTVDISKVYKRTMRISKILNELCKAAVKLTTSEYNTRRAEVLVRKDVPSEVDDVADAVSFNAGSVYIAENDPEIIQQYITELKPYLNTQKIVSIPPDLYKKFMAVPVYMIQKEYSGKRFLERYRTTINMIRSIA